MDHTHCFNAAGYLDATLSRIDCVKDEALYGLFPQFKPFVRAHAGVLPETIARLKTLDRQWVEGLVARIPKAWEVDGKGRAALANQVYNRADYVAGVFVELLASKLA